MSAARFAALALAAAALAACTNGGAPLTASAAGGGNVTVIDVNLTLNAPVRTQFGTSGGYAPPVTNVLVGSYIAFTNTDGFAHTATLIEGATAWPATSPFGISATTQTGHTLSGGFTSGAMQAGASSQQILVDKAGTYFFGCFFHYGAPMRGAIVAQ